MFLLLYYRLCALSFCPDSPQLMYRVESLERQLESETREKLQTLEKSATLEQRSHQLQKQLLDLEQQLKTEAEEKRRAEETSAALELKLAHLEASPSGPEKNSSDCEKVSVFFIRY